MAQCPVCQSEYVEEQVKFCTTYGWDLTPYPITFAGQLPEAFVEKQQAHLAWAIQMWARSLSHLENLNQVQSQLKSLKQEQSQQQSHLSEWQSQLKLCNQEALEFQSQLEHLTTEKAQLQSQFSQALSQIKEAENERSRLKERLAKVLSRLQQLSQECSSDIFAILSHLGRRLESREAQLQQAKNSLSHWIPNLTLQFAQELSHISDKTWATAQLDQLTQSGQKGRSISQPHKQELLLAIKSVLQMQEEEQVEKIRECLVTIDNNNPILQVDTLLSVRYELKLKGIIKRDIDGDTLYD